MKIANGDDRLTKLYLSGEEYRVLCNCLNEVSGALRIPDFDKWIGGTKAQVEGLLAMIHELKPNAIGELGEVRINKPGEGLIIVQLSLEYTKLWKNCVFETCNRIALWEFQTRTGMELETALGLLRQLESYVVGTER